MPKTLKGADYRVKRVHDDVWLVGPDGSRQDIPIVISDKSGTVIAKGGDLCADLTDEQLASVLKNGWVEPVEPSAKKGAA